MTDVVSWEGIVSIHMSVDSYKQAKKVCEVGKQFYIARKLFLEFSKCLKSFLSVGNSCGTIPIVVSSSMLDFSWSSIAQKYIFKLLRGKFLNQ